MTVSLPTLSVVVPQNFIGMSTETALSTPAGVVNFTTRNNGYSPGGTSFSTLFYINQSSGSYIWTAIDAFCQNNTNKQLVFELGQFANYLTTRSAIGGALGASGGGTKSNMCPDNLSGAAAAVTALVQRVVNTWGRTGQAYELWNEIDSTGYYADSVSLLGPYAKAMAQAILAVDSTATIIAPSIANPATGTAFITNFLNASDGAGGTAKQWVNAIAFHSYENFNTTGSADGGYKPTAVVNHFFAVQAAQLSAGCNFPIWVTEGGYASADPTQIADLQTQMVLLAGLGCARYIAFGYDDTEFAISPIISQWNIVASLLSGSPTVSLELVSDIGINATINGVRYVIGQLSGSSTVGSSTATLACATPVLSLAAGSYTTAQSVSISCSTPNSTIYYTTNGATPNVGSTQYSGAITVSASETIQAIAVAASYAQSAVASAAYTISQTAQTARPVVAPAAGTYSSSQTVTITCSTPSSTIYYTTDNSNPSTASTVYTGAITVSSSATVKAIATAPGYTQSLAGAATYTISSTPQVATPSFSPAAGSYSSTQSVTISTATSGATIYYTTDGSTPTTASAQYTSPVSVSASETLQALAVASSYTNSMIGSAAYTIGTASTMYIYQNYAYPANDNGQNATYNNDFSFTGYSSGNHPADWTGSISGTTMTVNSPNNFVVQGMSVGGSGVANGTYIVQQLTGTAMGAGNYQVNISQNVSSTAMQFPVNGGSVVVGNYLANPFPGHTYSLFIPGGTGGASATGGAVGYQPNSQYSAGNPNGSGNGPWGFNLGTFQSGTPNFSGGPYTWLTFSYYTAYSGRTFDCHCEYLGNLNNGTGDVGTSTLIDNIFNIPGVTQQVGNWSTIKFPLSAIGQLGQLAQYKFYLRDNTSNNSENWQLDNLGFIAGGYSWIYNGGMPNGYNSSNNTWNHDPSTTLNGWSDASTNAAINYSYAASNLTQLPAASRVSACGLVTPGYGSTNVSTNYIQWVPSATNSAYKVTTTSFALGSYTYFTFAALPTNGTYAYTVRFYDTSGTAVGNAVSMGAGNSQYTTRNWNQNGGNITVWNVPLSAFGSLPANIGGVSITDSSGQTSTIYLSGIGFFF